MSPILLRNIFLTQFHSRPFASISVINSYVLQKIARIQEYQSSMVHILGKHDEPVSALRPPVLFGNIQRERLLFV